MKKTLQKLAACAVLAAGLTTSAFAQIPNSGLVHKWLFDGNANDTRGTDHGTVSGATLTDDRFGNANSAYQFDGINDIITMDGFEPGKGDFTLSFWFKADTAKLTTLINQYDNGANGFSIGLDATNKPQFYVWDDANRHRGGNSSHGSSINNWHNLILTHDYDGYSRFYVDGVEKLWSSTGFLGNISSNNPLRIGSDGYSYFFKGAIDDILVYDRVLTQADINQIHFDGVCLVHIPDNFFKSKLVNDLNINTNGNSEIECSEAAAFSGTIYAHFAGISDLTGIEAFTSATGLWAYGNQLSDIDLSQNVALEEIDVDENALSMLDLSQNVLLEKISCSNNLLTSLILGNNTVLQELDCTGNALTSLNVSANTGLIRLDCSNNQLTSLNVANGNTLGGFESFFAKNNPNLSCIKVDAGFDIASSGWLNMPFKFGFDAGVNFSDNCGGATPPAAPTNLTLTPVGGTSMSITLNWTDNATDETGYKVERSTNGTTFTEIASLGANVTTYSDVTVAADVVYYYRVYAYNANGNSGFSNVANAITSGVTGINETDAQNMVSVYPNPASDVVTIANIPNGAVISVSDLAGKVVAITTPATETTTISTADFTNGIYLIRINTNGIVANKKLVINK